MTLGSIDRGARCGPSAEPPTDLAVSLTWPFLCATRVKPMEAAVAIGFVNQSIMMEIAPNYHPMWDYRLAVPRPSSRAMSMRWTSDVPSPISSTFASR
jgi:hypothetical protein